MSGPYNYQTNPFQGQANPYYYSQQQGSSEQGRSVNQPSRQDFFNLPNVYENVSPDMINTGLSVGQNMIRREWEKRLPGMSTFWHSMKIYFAVSNSYVMNKILLLLYPLSNQHWHRIPVDESLRDSEVSVPSENIDQNTRKWALPKHDTNAPDLYIPTMSFITYILLYGFIKGINLTTTFSPDLLISAIWRCLLIQLIEVGVIRFAFSTIGVYVPSLDITSYTGYKYVGLCANILSRCLGRFISILVLLYTSLMLGFFILKSLAAVVPQTANAGGPPRHLLIIGFAGLEFFLSLFLSWL